MATIAAVLEYRTPHSVTRIVTAASALAHLEAPEPAAVLLGARSSPTTSMSQVSTRSCWPRCAPEGDRVGHDLIIAATARSAGRVVVTAHARAFAELPEVMVRPH